MPGEQINTGYSLQSVNFSSGFSSLFGNPSLHAAAAHAWLWIIVVGYALSVVALIAIVYIYMQLFELRRREEHYYSTLISPLQASTGVNPRWEHVESLIHDENPSYWREAIIEADIMLDEALASRGYVGNGVGEKLKAVEPGDLKTLQDAWEVHKVRNQIAHEGSAFDLSDTIARRTVKRYEAILLELRAI
jgi:hypothetical protein